MARDYTPEQLQAFALFEHADNILFIIQKAMKDRENPTNNPIIFEITQGQFDVQKFRRLLKRWKDLIGTIYEEIPDELD